MPRAGWLRSRKKGGAAVFGVLGIAIGGDGRGRAEWMVCWRTSSRCACMTDSRSEPLLDVVAHE